MSKKMIILGILTIVLFSTYQCMRPAPSGTHGHYLILTDTATMYETSLTKDSLFNIFRKMNLTIDEEEDGPTKDSLGYILNNIHCNNQYIGAHLRFNDKYNDGDSCSFKVLWYNATPTSDNSIYQRLAREYDACFNDFLKNHNLPITKTQFIR